MKSSCQRIILRPTAGSGEAVKQLHQEVLGALPGPHVRALVIHRLHGHVGGPLGEAVVDAGAVTGNLVRGLCMLELLLQQCHVSGCIVHHARVQQYLGGHCSRAVCGTHHSGVGADAGVVAHHAQDVHAEDGHVHNTSAAKAVADHSNLRGVHEVVGLHLVNGSRDLGHVEIRIAAVRRRRGHPVRHVLHRSAVAIDVGGEAHIAQASQHARALLLVVVHAIPVLDNHNCWALHRGGAVRRLVCYVPSAGRGVAGVVYHHRLM